MIKKLSITNYILIDHLEMELSTGLNIVTGETGAGKSILMGALELLTGERADPKSLTKPDEKCVIEGWFSIDSLLLQPVLAEAEVDPEEETIIRREIMPSGKSRAFVNDTPVTLDVLKKVGALLIDVHGQHDTQLLATAEKQTSTFDILANTVEAKNQYQSSYTAWRQATRLLKDLKEKRDQEHAEHSFKQFVFNELERAGLKPGEQEQLEQEQVLLKNAEDIKLKLNQTLDLLDGENDITTALKTAAAQLEKLTIFSEDLGQLANRSRSVRAELADIIEEVRQVENTLQHSPERILQIEERLSELYTLEKKYRKETEADLIAYQESLSAELEQFSHLDEEIEKAVHLAEASENQMHQLGQILSQMRQAEAGKVSEKLLALIANMGMPKARFEVSVLQAEPSSSGLDKISFLFSANPGLAPAELKHNASGGEFSRLMLAFKCLLAESQAMPTLIFDEIDTGISGEVAAKVGQIMKNLATKHQVISITHSAQLAAQADTHWFVYKKQEAASTFTQVKALSATEKLEEIAKMISGSKVSEAALEAARELIAG